MVSERSQSEKATNCTMQTMGYSGKEKPMQTIKRSVVAKDSGGLHGDRLIGEAYSIFMALKLFCVLL